MHTHVHHEHTLLNKEKKRREYWHQVHNKQNFSHWITFTEVDTVQFVFSFYRCSPLFPFIQCNRLIIIIIVLAYVGKGDDMYAIGSVHVLYRTKLSRFFSSNSILLDVRRIHMQRIVVYSLLHSML